MIKSPTPAARRPWTAPRVKTLSTGGAEGGFVPINPEGDALGS